MGAEHAGHSNNIQKGTAMEQISYKEVGATITVRVGKIIAGSIIPDAGGFRYFSAKSKIVSELFKTIEEVKQSLEEE